jgi:hypothetical protein
MPLFDASRSAALLDAGVDLRHVHLLLDVTDPVVVDDVGLSGTGKADNRGGQSTGGDGGKSKLLHFDALFFVCIGSSFADLTA